MQTIPLDTLRFGHEATPPMNARFTGRQSEVSELGASIMAHGLIQALTVSEQDGHFYVVDGNRRLAALRHLATETTIPADHPVRCDLNGGTGIEVSLAANLMRLPMHQADIYVTMRDLAAGGLTEDDIAGRFGIDKKRVRRMLTLGALAPVIIEAWRDGKIGHDEVKAFTLATDIESQEKAFADLSRSPHLLKQHYIRTALGATHNLNKELKLVTLDEYRAAGGHVIEDLFGEQHNIADPELLRNLADAKVANLLADLLSEGWSWVARGDTLPDAWVYNWRHVPCDEVSPTKDEATLLRKLKKKIDAADPAVDDDEMAEETEHAALNAAIAQRGWTEEIKAKSGAVAYFSHAGDLKIERGVCKPVVKAKTKPASVTVDGLQVEVEDEPVGISMALRTRLSEQLTAAAQQALLSNPTAALAALVAAMTTDTYHGQPIGLTYSQYVKKPDVEFTDEFARLCSMRDAELMAAFTAALAPHINMRVTYSGHQKTPAVTALLDALDQAPLRDQSPLAAALISHFDAEDYFGSSPKGAIVTAIRETVGDAEANRMAGSKKKELVKYAMARVAGTDWLPPELRTASYVGPQVDSKAA